MRGQWGDRRVTLYVQIGRIERGALIQARNVKVGEYELSVLTVSSDSAEPVVRTCRAFNSPTHPELKVRRRRSSNSTATTKQNRALTAQVNAQAAAINKAKEKKVKKVAAVVDGPKPGKMVLIRQEHHELNAKDRQGRQHTVHVAVKKRRVVKLDRS